MKTSLSKKLAGAWALVYFELESSDGNISYPLGKDAEGSIFYTEDGFVSVNIMRKGRDSIMQKGKDQTNEWRWLDLPYLAYSGKYILEEDELAITHWVEVGLYPEWIGQAQYRLISWLGEDLQLSTTNSAGVDGEARLVWTRRKA
jgi:hypothetical protein